MSTILFTKEGLDSIPISTNYASGLVCTGTASSTVKYTISSGLDLYRPFYKGTAYATTQVPHPGKFLAGGPAGLTKLIIYSGERPDISNITSLSAYDSQKLISFNVAAYSSARGSTGLYVDPGTTSYSGFRAICGICPTLTTASASGTATWFWFGICLTDAEAKVFNAGYSGNYSNLAGYQFVTGSVGLLGSGSDLEIADKNIVSGQQYKSFGFNFYIPSVNTIIE